MEQSAAHCRTIPRRVSALCSVGRRVHLVQLCYNLSDPGMEDLLYEAESVRRFVGVRLSEPQPTRARLSSGWRDITGVVCGDQRVSGVRLQEGTIARPS